MLLLCLLMFKHKQKIVERNKVYVFNTFGFEKNGTYTVSFENRETQELYFTLYPSSIMTFKLILSTSASRYCLGNNSIMYHIPISTNTSTFSGIIPFSDIYTPIVYNCGNDKTIVKVSLIFANVHSLLDYRWYGADIVHMALSACLIGLLIYWSIIWYLNRRQKVKIHWFIAATILLTIAYNISRMFELLKLHKTDDAVAENAIRIVFSILSNISLYITLTLVSKGWCIYKEVLCIKDYLPPLIYIILYTITSSVSNYAYLGNIDIVTILLSIIFIGLYLRELLVSISNAKTQFKSHLLAIYRSGILPKSTPIFSKLQSFKYLNITLVVYVVVIILRIAIVLFVEPFLWINEFILNAIECALLLAVCIIYRPRGGSVNNDYHGIDICNISDISPVRVSLNDVESFKPNFEDKNLTKWEPEVLLPPMPIIVDEKDHCVEEITADAL